MARMPLNLSWSWSGLLNQDGTIDLSWTVEDGNLNVLATHTANLRGDMGFTDAMAFLSGAVRSALSRQFTISDIPKTGSVNLALTDLL